MSNAPTLVPLSQPATKTCAYDAYTHSLSVVGRKGIISLLKRSVALFLGIFLLSLANKFQSIYYD